MEESGSAHSAPAGGQGGPGSNPVSTGQQPSASPQGSGAPAAALKPAGVDGASPGATPAPQAGAPPGATPPAAVPPPAGVASPAVPPDPGFLERGGLRRRLRFLRKTRELAYRDLGGLMFELHRTGTQREDLLRGKLVTLERIDTELRAIEDALHERRGVTVLREAGVTACPRCAAIHGSEDRFCPACGFSAGRSERPIAASPVATLAGAPAGTPAQAPPATPQSATTRPHPSPPSPAPVAPPPVAPAAAPVSARPAPVPPPSDADQPTEIVEPPTQIVRPGEPPAGKSSRA